VPWWSPDRADEPIGEWIEQTGRCASRRGIDGGVDRADWPMCELESGRRGEGVVACSSDLPGDVVGNGECVRLTASFDPYKQKNVLNICCLLCYVVTNCHVA
jgi:hypothetical protein